MCLSASGPEHGQVAALRGRREEDALHVGRGELGVVRHEQRGDAGDILDHLGMCLSDDFDVKHSTFQLETPEHVQWEARAEQAQR